MTGSKQEALDEDLKNMGSAGSDVYPSGLYVALYWKPQGPAVSFFDLPEILRLFFFHRRSIQAQRRGKMEISGGSLQKP